MGHNHSPHHLVIDYVVPVFSLSPFARFGAVVVRRRGSARGARAVRRRGTSLCALDRAHCQLSNAPFSARTRPIRSRDPCERRCAPPARPPLARARTWSERARERKAEKGTEEQKREEEEEEDEEEDEKEKRRGYLGKVERTKTDAVASHRACVLINAVS